MIRYVCPYQLLPLHNTERSQLVHFRYSKNNKFNFNKLVMIFFIRRKNGFIKVLKFKVSLFNHKLFLCSVHFARHTVLCF